MGQCSSLFNGNREQTLVSRITPTAEQREFLQTQWNELANHLKSELTENYGFTISTWLQGSYKYGTLIKPVKRNEEYDVDVGIYFNWTDENEAPTPQQLRYWVQEELLAYKDMNASLREISEPPKERCSRAIYVKQFHIDTPTYHLDPSTDQRRLACLSGNWEDSDPKLLYKWFKNIVDEDYRDQLRRLIRYLKAWAAIAFDEAPDSRPSSIFLTVLTAEAYKGLWAHRLIGINDEDALIEVINIVHERLFNNKDVFNPIDDNENINRMGDDAWNGFLPRLQDLKDIADRAKAAESEANGALVWSEAFSFLMPLPETDEVEMIEESTGLAVMVLPDIDIQIYQNGSAHPTATYRNHVPHVNKNSTLIFKIANPHILPDHATIEWTVRNEGKEADDVSDLGHRQIGVRQLQNEEHAAYAGKHYMDCIIRSNGQVYAVRRVPVQVSNLQPQARNQPRPAYTRIKGFLKRRR